MDEEVPQGSAGFMRRERERLAAEKERLAAEKARTVLEARLAEAQASFKDLKTDSSKAGKQAEMDTLRKEISEQIKRDVEKAKREAELERSYRQAEAVISNKLYEKEEAAKKRMLEAKKAERIDKRKAKQDAELMETFAEVEEAERLRKKKLAERAEIKAAAEKAKHKEETKVLSAAEKEVLRKQHIEAAAKRAEQAEADKAAEAERRAARLASGGGSGKTSKGGDDAPSKPVVMTRSRVPANAVEWKIRRSALESLQQITDSETRCTPEGIRSAINKAVAIGLADDIPELCAARMKEHDVAIAAATEIIERTTGEVAFAKEQWETLVGQGYNRAAGKAERKMNAAQTQKTEAEGMLQFHEAQQQSSADALEACLEERRAQGRPESQLEEDLEGPKDPVKVEVSSSSDSEDDEATLQQRLAARKKREEKAAAKARRFVAELEAKERAREAARQRHVEREEAAAQLERVQAQRRLAAREAAHRREVEARREARRVRKERDRAAATRAEAAKAEAAALAEARDAREIGVYCRPTSEYSDDPDVARAQIASDRAAADLEVKRCRESAKAAAADVASLRARKAEYLALRAEERENGLPRTPPPKFVSSLPTAPPERTKILPFVKPKPPAPPDHAPAPKDPVRADGAAPPGGAASAKPANNPPVSKPKITGKAPKDRSPSPRRTPRPRPQEPERAPEAREPLLVEKEPITSDTKLALHYLCADDDSLSISLALTVPVSWHKKPAKKLADFFRKTYASRKAAPAPGGLRLRTLAGTDVGAGSVYDALMQCDGALQLC